MTTTTTVSASQSALNALFAAEEVLFRAAGALVDAEPPPVASTPRPRPKSAARVWAEETAPGARDSADGLWSRTVAAVARVGVPVELAAQVAGVLAAYEAWVRLSRSSEAQS